METEYGYLDCEGPDDEAVRLGVNWLLDRAALGGSREAALFVPQVQSAENLVSALGAAPVRDLQRKHRTIISGVTIVLITERLRQPWSGPLLAVWADDEHLAHLERPNVPALCVVSRTHSGIDCYKARRRPTELRTGERAGGHDPITSPVVGIALDRLTHAVNLSTGLSHPSDKSRAVWTLKHLRDAGESFTAAEVRLGAAHRGWRADHASDLAEFAAKVLDRHGIKAGLDPFRPGVIELWRSASSPSTTT